MELPLALSPLSSLSLSVSLSLSHSLSSLGHKLCFLVLKEHITAYRGSSSVFVFVKKFKL